MTANIFQLSEKPTRKCNRFTAWDKILITYKLKATIKSKKNLQNMLNYCQKNVSNKTV